MFKCISCVTQYCCTDEDYFVLGTEKVVEALFIQGEEFCNKEF